MSPPPCSRRWCLKSGRGMWTKPKGLAEGITDSSQVPSAPSPPRRLGRIPYRQGFSLRCDKGGSVQLDDRFGSGQAGSERLNLRTDGTLPPGAEHWGWLKHAHAPNLLCPAGAAGLDRAAWHGLVPGAAWGFEPRLLQPALPVARDRSRSTGLRRRFTSGS